MKKKLFIAALTIILLILIIPLPLHLKDGGTVKYQALLYSISDVHRISSADEYEDGVIVEILGLEVFNNVKTEVSDDRPAEDTEPEEVSVPSPSYEAELSYANIPATNKIYQECLNLDKLPENVRHLPVYKFESTDELDSFKADFKDELVMDSGWDEIASFNEVTEKFDGGFFEENTLLLVYIDSTNCTHRFGVENIKQEDGYLCIYLEETTGATEVDTAMAGWYLTVPAAKSTVADVKEFDAILDHSYDLVGNTASAFREPPVLTLSTGVSEVEALKGTLTWNYTDENGKGVFIAADSSHPLVMKDCMPSLAVVPTTNAYTYALDTKLSFGTVPNILPPAAGIPKTGETPMRKVKISPQIAKTEISPLRLKREILFTRSPPNGRVQKV